MAGTIRSGRLCNSGGRHCTSQSSHWLARFNAVISLASAPQAMISVLGCSGCTASGQQALGGFNRNGGVAAIRIRTDGLAELLVQRRTAQQDDVVIANTFVLHGVD